MPSPRPPAARVSALPRVRAGRVVLALAMVGLVLLMHALTVPAGAADAVAAGGHDGAAGAAHVAAATTSTGHETTATQPPAGEHQAPVPGHAGAHGAVALVCLAVLALTALLVLRPGSGRGWWSARPGASHRDPAVAPVRTRGPAPPDLHQLSILRC